MVYCIRCRYRIDPATHDFWQGTAWCARCSDVVSAAWCKVPIWILATICLLALRIQALA